MSLTPFERSCMYDIDLGRPEFRAEDARVHHWLCVGIWSMVRIGASLIEALVSSLYSGRHQDV